MEFYYVIYYYQVNSFQRKLLLLIFLLISFLFLQSYSFTRTTINYSTKSSSSWGGTIWINMLIPWWKPRSRDSMVSKQSTSARANHIGGHQRHPNIINFGDRSKIGIGQRNLQMYSMESCSSSGEKTWIISFVNSSL